MVNISSYHTLIRSEMKIYSRSPLPRYYILSLRQASSFLPEKKRNKRGEVQPSKDMVLSYTLTICTLLRESLILVVPVSLGREPHVCDAARITSSLGWGFESREYGLWPWSQEESVSSMVIIGLVQPLRTHLATLLRDMQVDLKNTRLEQPLHL